MGASEQSAIDTRVTELTALLIAAHSTSQVVEPHIAEVERSILQTNEHEIPRLAMALLTAACLLDTKYQLAPASARVIGLLKRLLPYIARDLDSAGDARWKHVREQLAASTQTAPQTTERALSSQSTRGVSLRGNQRR